MESIRVVLNNDATYDALVHGGLKQASAITVCSKRDATVGGKPGVVIAFDVRLPDGTIRQVQATTTLALLENAWAALSVSRATESPTTIYTHPGCTFNYCPHPELCQSYTNGCVQVK